MNLSKLREQIADLKAEREHIDSAIQALERVLSGLGPDQGRTAERPRLHLEHKGTRGSRRQEQSYRALAIKILREAGKPVHITEITNLVSQLRGKLVARAAVESSLIRAMKKPSMSGRLKRDAPGMFVLRADA
jgi:hypothetical protein